MKFSRVTIAFFVLILIQVAFLIADIAGERRERRADAMATALKMAMLARSATDDFFDRYLAVFS